MAKDTNGKKKNKVKQFFTGLVEKIDKKMEEKAKNSSGCCGSGKGKDDPCCN